MHNRYIAFSFDDGRDSDFAWIAPLFTRYGARATFNIINATEHALCRAESGLCRTGR